MSVNKNPLVSPINYVFFLITEPLHLLKKSDEIVIVEADEDKGAVVLDNSDYVDKCIIILQS